MEAIAALICTTLLSIVTAWIAYLKTRDANRANNRAAMSEQGAEMMQRAVLSMQTKKEHRESAKRLWTEALLRAEDCSQETADHLEDQMAKTAEIMLPETSEIDLRALLAELNERTK